MSEQLYHCTNCGQKLPHDAGTGSTAARCDRCYFVNPPLAPPTALAVKGAELLPPKARTLAGSVKPSPGERAPHIRRIPDSSYRASRHDPSPRGSNALAVAGFVLAFFAPLIGLIFCAIALSQLSGERGEQEGGRSLAIAGLVVSGCFMGLVFLLVLAV